MLIPAGIRAIFFDAVGTLIHPEPPAPSVYAVIGRRHGSHLDTHTIIARFRLAFQHEEELDRALGWRTSEAREIERWRRIVVAVLDDVCDSHACFAELFDHFARPESWRCDGAIPTLLPDLAARGYELGIASNYDRRLRSVVAGLPALRCLDRLVISAEAGWRKPSGEFFAALCQCAGFAPEEILLVGDDVANDYEGGRAAGLKVVLLDREEQSRTSERMRIRSLSELPF
jgi:putative hydrolase of the HAD superfamily